VGPWRTAEEVTLSGVRGRGGGGFRTGRKWLSVLEASRDDERRFVVCNAAEGEPGTFKDRAILRHNPYQVIEGLAIAALTVGASHADVAVKSTFDPEIAILRRAWRRCGPQGSPGFIVYDDTADMVAVAACSPVSFMSSRAASAGRASSTAAVSATHSSVWSAAPPTTTTSRSSAPTCAW
jgi:hypothetical protein